MKRTILALTAAALLTAPSAWAAGEEMGGSKDEPRARPSEMVEMMDTNNDGSVSKDEYMKHKEQMFAKHDKDSDNKLSQSEVQQLISKEQSGQKSDSHGQM